MDEDPVASEATIGDDVIRTNISDCNCINKSKIINIILNGENLINKNFDPEVSSGEAAEVATDVKVKIVKTKRHANIQRPSNWKDIAEHYKIHRNCTKTIKIFNLELLNPSYEYWIATLGKWIKQACNPSYISYRGRSSVIGRNIENELIIIIKKHHLIELQPITYTILRRHLMSLLLQHNCIQILKQIDDGDLIFGKNWFSRFLKRNKLIINQDGGIQSLHTNDNSDIHLVHNSIEEEVLLTEIANSKVDIVMRSKLEEEKKDETDNVDDKDAD
jgi:hypothetical protein